MPADATSSPRLRGASSASCPRKVPNPKAARRHSPDAGPSSQEAGGHPRGQGTPGTPLRVHRGPPSRFRCEAVALWKAWPCTVCPQEGSVPPGPRGAPTLPGVSPEINQDRGAESGVDGAFHGYLSSGIQCDRNLWNASSDLCVLAALHRLVTSRQAHTLFQP